MFVSTELIEFLYTILPVPQHKMTYVCCQYGKLTSATNVILSPEKTPKMSIQFPIKIMFTTVNFIIWKE